MLHSDAGASWQDVARVSASAQVRYQDADPLQSAARAGYQDAQRRRLSAATAWQAAQELRASPVVVRHQDAQARRREVAVRWQEAVRGEISHVEGFGVANALGAVTVVRWQAAMQPQPARSVMTTRPAGEPCYTPSTALLLRERQQHSTSLAFMCERHLPPPGTGTTVVVPILDVYSVQNSIQLVRLDSDHAAGSPSSVRQLLDQALT